MSPHLFSLLAAYFEGSRGVDTSTKKDTGSVFRGKSLESTVRCPCCTLSRRNAKSSTRCKEPSVTMGAAVEHSPKSNYLVAHVFQDTRPGVKPYSTKLGFSSAGQVWRPSVLWSFAQGGDRGEKLLSHLTNMR